MIWNGMQNVYVEYTPTLQVTGGSLSHGYGPNDAGETLLEQSYDAHITEAYFTGNKNTANLKDGQIRVNVELDATQAADNRTITADLDIAHLGEQVKVIWKNSDPTATTQTLDTKDKIYGVYPTGETETVHATLADVKDNFADEAKIKVGDDKYEVNDPVNVFTNYGAAVQYGTGKSKDIDDGDKDNETNSGLTSDLKKDNGSSLKLILNDGKVTDIYIVTKKLGNVTAVNSTRVSIDNGVGSIKIADNEVYEGIAKDDVVVTTELYTGDNKLVIVEKAEKVTGELEGYTVKTVNTSTKKVVLDGTTYTVVDHAAMPTTVGDETGEAYIKSGAIGETFDLYLVDGFVAAAVQTSESASNYSLVISTSGSASTDKPGDALNGLRIQVLGADGTKTILNVSEDSRTLGGAAGSLDGGDDITVGDIVTYTMNKDGDADVKIVGKSASSKTYSYTKKTKTFNDGSDDFTTAKNCVLFVKTTATGGYKAFNIRSLGNNDISNGTGCYVKDGDDVVAVYMAMETDPTGATSSRVYGIVSGDNGTVAVDGNEYTYYTVGVNEEEYKVYTNDSFKKGDIVTFEPADDDVYGANKVEKVADNGSLAASKAVAGYVHAYSKEDGTLTFSTDKNTTSVLAINDDADIYYVDQDKDEGTTGSIGKYDSINQKKNVIVILDANQDIDVIIFETSSEADIINAAI